MQEPSVVDIEDVVLPAEERELFQRSLLQWYRENRRKLPWRGDPPPYGADPRAGLAAADLTEEWGVRKVEKGRASLESRSPTPRE
jgi:A/G-specific adenine glycosylase